MKKRYTVAYKRKTQGRTNYKKRLALLKSNKPRLVIRTSSSNLTAQIVEFNPKGDQITASAHTKDLVKLGWKAPLGNSSAAYLTGLLIGKKAAKKGVKEAIVDTGLHKPVRGSRVYAAVKGAKEAGISIPVDEEVFPSEDRILGKHISGYAAQCKGKETKQFSKCIKENVGVEKMPELVEACKKKIMGAE
ncbi:MAG: 50S ribosomal protein L18 [Nanoarchaeota archaeon]|nr:50S ribosomal protein L18 [Nanoarchaeota archaeon]